MKKSYVKSRKEYDNDNELDSKKILAAMKRYKESPKKPTSVADKQGIPYQVLIRVFILDDLERLKKSCIEMGIVKRPPTLKMATPGSHVLEKQARISKSGDREYPNLGKVKGYGEFPELDSVIQFWPNFCKEQGLKFPEDLDSFLIKAIIAVES